MRTLLHSGQGRPPRRHQHVYCECFRPLLIDTLDARRQPVCGHATWRPTSTPACPHRGDDAYTRELLELVAIPSVSSLPDNHGDLLRAAGWLEQRMKAAGLEVGGRAGRTPQLQASPGLALAAAGAARCCDVCACAVWPAL